MFALNPIKENLAIKTNLEKLKNQTISPINLVKYLGRCLNQRHPVTVKFYDGKDFNLNLGTFCLAAEYDPCADSEGKKPFTINLVMNYPKSHPYLWSEADIDYLIMELLESLVHEYQHQRQYKKRNYRSAECAEKIDSHYASEDEIEAYAANIATRLFLLDERLNTNIETCSSLDLRHYVSTFGQNHKIVKRLLNQITINLQTLEELQNGKVSRNTHGGARNRRVSQ